jgi:hypothetical protein
VGVAAAGTAANAAIKTATAAKKRRACRSLIQKEP